VFNHICGRRNCVWLLLAVFALSGAACGRKSAAVVVDNEPRSEAKDYKLTGPFTHENLTIYLIHGDDKLQGKKLISLDEALEQKKVVIHETQEVSELAIENASDDDDFVPSGEIIKGGQQDRVITSDLIVSAKSGKLPLAAFCVEHGRWSRRGAESVGFFDSSLSMAPSKNLQIANRCARSQAGVWKQVANTQGSLAKNVGGSVQSPVSESSLQLSLEDKKVQEAAQAYIKELASIADKDDDLIGFAVAINGEVNSADVYASHDLFKRLWPKLLKASAIEALSALEKDKKFETPAIDAVTTFLTDAEKGTPSTTDVNRRFTLIQQESENCLLFDTRDKEQNAVTLRRNYLAK
jgi:hypothetical protein